jgi:hypothetical protein
VKGSSKDTRRREQKRSIYTNLGLKNVGELLKDTRSERFILSQNHNTKGPVHETQFFLALPINALVPRDIRNYTCPYSITTAPFIQLPKSDSIADAVHVHLMGSFTPYFCSSPAHLPRYRADFFASLVHKKIHQY